MTSKDLAKELETKSKRFAQAGDYQKAKQHMGMAAVQYEQQGDRLEAGLAYFSVASLGRLAGDSDIVTHFEHALTHFEAVGSTEWLERTYERIIRTLSDRGKIEEAEGYAEKYLALEQTQQTPVSYFTALFYLFFAKTKLGKTDEARALVKDAFATGILDKDVSLSQTARFLTRDITDKADLVRSRAFEAELEKAGNIQVLGYVYYERAVKLADHGKQKQALALFFKARSSAVKSGDLMLYFHASLAMMLLYNAKDSHYKVVETLMVTAATLSKLLGEQIKELFFQFARVFETLWGPERFKEVYEEFLHDAGVLK